MGGLLFWKKKSLEVRFEQVCLEGRGRSLQEEGPNTKKSAGSNSGMSGTSNLEAERTETERRVRKRLFRASKRCLCGCKLVSV